MTRRDVASHLHLGCALPRPTLVTPPLAFILVHLSFSFSFPAHRSPSLTGAQGPPLARKHERGSPLFVNPKTFYKIHILYSAILTPRLLNST